MLQMPSPSRGRRVLGSSVTFSLMFVLVLLLPVSAHAQAITPADLVGTWERAVTRHVISVGVSPTGGGPIGALMNGVAAAYDAANRGGGSRQDVTEYDTLVIRADSTFRFVGRNLKNDFKRWNYLRGDTISFIKSDPPYKGDQGISAPPCEGGPGYCGEPGYKITLKDQQLTLTALGKTGTWENGTYRRVDTPKPTP